jgi:hypothetical protein
VVPASKDFSNEATRVYRVGFSHSETPGSKVVCHLPEDYRRLLRPSSAFCAKASTIYPFLLFSSDDLTEHQVIICIRKKIINPTGVGLKSFADIVDHRSVQFIPRFVAIQRREMIHRTSAILDIAKVLI